MWTVGIIPAEKRRRDAYKYEEKLKSGIIDENLIINK